MVRPGHLGLLVMLVIWLAAFWLVLGWLGPLLGCGETAPPPRWMTAPSRGVCWETLAGYPHECVAIADCPACTPSPSDPSCHESGHRWCWDWGVDEFNWPACPGDVEGTVSPCMLPDDAATVLGAVWSPCAAPPCTQIAPGADVDVQLIGRIPLPCWEGNNPFPIPERVIVKGESVTLQKLGMVQMGAVWRATEAEVMAGKAIGTARSLCVDSEALVEFE